MEGKWVADSREAAKNHGESLYPGQDYSLIEAVLPNSAPSLFQLPNLDGNGPARYIEIENLDGVIPRILEFL